MLTRTPYTETQGHMKQKALPAGTAWVLGGGVKKKMESVWVYREACAYGQQASFNQYYVILKKKKKTAVGKCLQ